MSGNVSNHEEIDQAAYRGRGAGGEGNEPQDTYPEQVLNQSPAEVAISRHIQSQ